MSYCRFGEGDVYLYAGGAYGWTCCACRLQPQIEYKVHGIEGSMHDNKKLRTRKAVLAHLLRHREAGHKVPRRALDRIRREMKDG